MTEDGKPVPGFRCMFCGKWYLTAEACDHHEEECPPDNWRPFGGEAEKP